MPTSTSTPDLTELAARTDFLWHQRFQIAPGVFAPGLNDVDWLLDRAGLPTDLTGASILDIGTTNGGAAFTLERRGASRVLATDIVDPMHFGFDAIRSALGSEVEFRQLSVYELSRAIRERFDYVIFWGVLYHLRHPLLALDNVWAVSGGNVYVETVVCDAEMPEHSKTALTRYFRDDELGGDSSNWFTPNVQALTDWCRSSGLQPQSVSAWPKGAPTRAMVIASAVLRVPEYQRVSYERPMFCSVADPEVDRRLHSPD